MTKLVFPSEIPAPSYPYSEELVSRLISTETESGHIVRRPRYSQQLTVLDVQWRGLKEEQWQIIRHFYDQTGGGSLSFDWYDIPTKQTLRMIFQSSPKATIPTILGRRDVSVSLREVRS